MFGKNRLQMMLSFLPVFLLMLVAGCRSTVEETFIPFTPVPTAVTPELPEGVKWNGDADALEQVLPQWPSVDYLTAASVPNSINLVTLADLHNTVGIEVCHLDCASYTPLYTIDNPELVATLVDALDTDMPLRPHARCPATYQLRFILANGQHYDFGYTCQMMTPTFLRGNQEFWMDQDAIAPDAFNALMMPLIPPERM
jgi:hypothetical protein